MGIPGANGSQLEYRGPTGRDLVLIFKRESMGATGMLAAEYCLQVAILLGANGGQRGTMGARGQPGLTRAFWGQRRLTGANGNTAQARKVDLNAFS